MGSSLSSNLRRVFHVGHHLVSPFIAKVWRTSASSRVSHWRQKWHDKQTNLNRICEVIFWWERFDKKVSSLTLLTQRLRQTWFQSKNRVIWVWSRREKCSQESFSWPHVWFHPAFLWGQVTPLFWMSTTRRCAQTPSGSTGSSFIRPGRSWRTQVAVLDLTSFRPTVKWKTSLQ